MCGIAGIVNIEGHGDPPSIETLKLMIEAIAHRGPDEYGLYRDECVGLVHARLSIIDLSTGQQPLCNEDETIWIVFNGEIFNFIELRRQLEGHGHRFRTKSDAEVIVHAYETWEEECFSKFNGQWAVVLWDSRSHTLVLSRDKIGVRPLYVHQESGRLWFASEVKAIFADQRVRRALDPHGLDQTFTYWASIAPTTVFQGIEELPPGSVRTYRENREKREQKFWYPSYPVTARERFPGTLADATDVLRTKLMDATRLRVLRADVPVGSYLSGGLDSSLIAWMGRHAKAGEFRTYSIRFEDAEFDETAFQRAMAATLDSTHKEIVVRRSDIARVFPDVVRHAERPILRTAPAPLYLLSMLVRDDGIKAVLTGEGADEMLSGYDLFKEAKIRHFWSIQPDSKVRPRLFDRLYPYLARAPQHARGMALEFWRRGLEKAGQPGFSHDPRWNTTASLKRFFSPALRSVLELVPAPNILDNLPPEFGEWDQLAQAQYLEVVTLLSGYLISSQGDRMLMAHSVEGRFPFLDAEVMDFCNTLPPDYKLACLNEKYVLKRVAKGSIPDEIINRPKQPYRSPDAVSFVVADAPEYIGELLSPCSVKDSGIFDPDAVSRLYTKCREGVRGGERQKLFSNTDNMALVGILSAQLLDHQFIHVGTGCAGPQILFTTLIDRLSVPTYQ